MRRRDLLGGLSLVPLAAPAVAQCVVATFPRINRADRCEGDGVSPPSLDLGFMTPGTLDPRITFTRASTATYFDSAGVMQTAATNAPRWDYDPATLQLRGLLIEEARTNLLLNSATLSTQSVTVTAVAHTLSFYGTGTITRSGVSTGALVGTGATQRVSVTFTPTAGSLTCTVSGSVTNAQLEADEFASSYIPTTGSIATRAVDDCKITGAGFSSWFSNSAGSFALEVLWSVLLQTATLPTRMAELTDGTITNFLGVVAAFTTNQCQISSTIAGVGGTTLTPSVVPIIGQAMKIGWTYGSSRTASVNAGAVVSTAGGIGTVNQMQFGNRVDLSRGGSVYIRRMRFWPVALSDAEIQEVTR